MWRMTPTHLLHRSRTTTRSQSQFQPQSDHPDGGKEDWEGARDDRDVIVKDERIVVEAGGTTPITLAEDQLLDNQVGTGAETPSGAVTELLSQMNMDSPATSQVASGPPDEGQDA